MVAAALPWTLLWLAAWLATRDPRRLPASGRHLIWTLTLTGLVVLPMAQRVMPKWAAAPHWQPAAQWQSVTQWQPERIPAEHTFSNKSQPSTPGPVGTLNPGPESVEVKQAAAREPGISPMVTVTHILTWTWAAVAVALLAFWILGHLNVHQLAVSAAPGSAPNLLQAARLAARDTGLRRSFSLLVGERRVVPMTWGFLRPAVLLPGDWSTWTPGRLRTVLLHELAHIQRYDAFSLALARLACALFWFHPGVWHAARRLRAEAENACDDAVVRSGLPATDYAEHLLALARSFNQRARPNPVASASLTAVSIGMARPGGLESRLCALLDEGRPRVASSRLQAGLLLGALGTILALATLTAAGAGPAEDWLEPITNEETGATSWAIQCAGATPERLSLCTDSTRKALALLHKSGKTGTIVIQGVDTGEIAAYASTTDSATPIPLAAPASLAKLALAGLWWELGLGDEKRDCPGQWQLADGRRVQNYRQHDLGLITVPREMIVQSCNTAAASMAQELLERLSPGQVHQRYADFGFASPAADERLSVFDEQFWGTYTRLRTSPPRPRAEAGREYQHWPLLAAGLGQMRTTPLHISRFLQAVGNNGMVLEPRPVSISAEHPARQTLLLSPETAARLRTAMDQVVSEGTGRRITPQLEWSDWRLGGKTGSAQGRGENVDGWFVGLAYGAEGQARYTVVVWIEDGGPGGGRPAGIAAEMTRFLARADGGEL